MRDVQEVTQGHSEPAELRRLMALRTSNAYLRLVQVLDDLASQRIVRPLELTVLREAADALLFGDPANDRWLGRSEAVFESLARREQLTRQEIHTLRERLWDIEALPQATLAS